MVMPKKQKQKPRGARRPRSSSEAGQRTPEARKDSLHGVRARLIESIFQSSRQFIGFQFQLCFADEFEAQ
jgi:hypothetical protein